MRRLDRIARLEATGPSRPVVVAHSADETPEDALARCFAGRPKPGSVIYINTGVPRGLGPLS